MVPETPASDSDVLSTPATPTEAVTLAATCRSDATNTSLIRYSVLEGSSIGSINETTGVFSLAVESLDYETQSEYSARLLCYFEFDPSVNATAPLIVTVTPVNEYLPSIMSDGITTTTILEDASPNILVAAVDSSRSLIPYRATDRDAGTDGIISYFLVDLQDEIFDLEQLTGVLRLRAVPDIDVLQETYKRYDFSIAACNEHIDIPNCNKLSFSIFVTAANDIPPQFEPPVYPVSLLESSSSGLLVARPLCVDRDNGVGSSVTISFSEETPEMILERFLLDPTGVATLQATLDYEEGPVSYQFELVCSDGDHEAVAEVLVAVLPVNDNPPVFLQDQYHFTVDRTSPAGHSAGRAEAEDRDIGTGGNITYSIDDTSYFTIHSSTGDIRIRDHIPSSAGSRFQLRVFATDGDFSANASVTVTVRGALSQPEFAGIVSGVLIFIALVVTILSLVGVCCCCYIRATRRRYMKILYITLQHYIADHNINAKMLLWFEQNFILYCLTHTHTRSVYAVDRATLSADVTPSQKVVRFADDEFSPYFPAPQRQLVLTNQSASGQLKSALKGDSSSSPTALEPQEADDQGTASSSTSPANEQEEETSFAT